MKLTKRGKRLAVATIVILTLLAMSFINVNYFTPEKCRDGILNIKTTEQCHQFRIGS